MISLPVLEAAAHAVAEAGRTSIGLAQYCSSMPAAVRKKIEGAEDGGGGGGGASHPCHEIWTAGPGDLAAAHAEGLSRAAPPPEPLVQGAIVAVLLALVGAAAWYTWRTRHHDGC